MSVTIEEAANLKRQMKINIATAIIDFEIKTGLVVDSLDIKRTYSTGDNKCASICVEANIVL